ncbi:N-acetylmuramoyl-L-alanine amidase family protein [Desulfofundulus thermobenzoicus]|uniref:N-acetylmuramoyl-L-alanine amidase family protein n=1 Tax=Desulfofundulus thermobenzoicus TaxID=29376 RepID=UPI00311A96F8
MEQIKVLVFSPRKIRNLVIAFLLLAIFSSSLHRVASARHKDSIQALSWALARRVVVVDPGHGGVDPGAVGKNNVLEKDLVLAVGHRLALYLRQAGASVTMTREEDRDLADPELQGLYKRKRQDLARRVDLAHRLKADALISIHINSFPNPSESGIQTFARADSPESYKLARCIQSEMNTLLKVNGRVPLRGDFYLLRESRVPAVIVEIGFITNPREYKLLQDPLYQSKLAWCLYAGIVKYFAEQNNEQQEKGGRQH